MPKQNSQNSQPTEKWETYNLVLGYSERFNDPFPEITNYKDRFEHTYIIGKTGMGKSSLLEHMALYDIECGMSVIFIDPKGDSVRKIYEQCTDHSRIQYISIESPVIINPLNKEGYRLDNLIQEFIQILDVLITLTSSNPESTVLMREIITMAMQSIKNEKNKNIKYLTELLLYQKKRKELLAELAKIDFNGEEYIYWKEFDTRNSDKVDCAKRVASRLLEISRGEMKKFVVGKNELDIASIVNTRKILLIDTSRMNRNSKIYLSNLVVYSLLSYIEFAEHKTIPLQMYIDEFSIIVSTLFSELLARSRSSKVGFTLAHQSSSQLSPKILGDIIGNVSTHICFRCGDDDAKKYSSLFGVKSQTLLDLPKYQAFVRIGTDNMLIETFPPKLPNPSLNIENHSEVKLISNQQPLQFSEPSIDLLRDEWISF